MQVSPLRKILFKNIFQFSSLLQGGDLYTWGITSLGSGIDQQVQPDQLVPRKVDFFRGDVAKVSTGLDATAVITTNGTLFTFGQNSSGQLGLGHKSEQRTPSEVTYFSENGLKVSDVAMGSKHAVAITDDGNVWAWGSNGTSIPFLNSIFPNINALGTVTNRDFMIPTLIDNLRGKVRPQTITAGSQFTILQEQNGTFWNWGKGSLGQFGNGYEENLVFPEPNPLLKQFQKKTHLSIQKLKTAGDGTIALLSDGKLIGWGANNLGQLGIREQEFVRTGGKSCVPMEVNRKYMKQDEKVLDFDLSQDNLIYYTDQNNVYFTGNDQYYVPYKIFEGKQDKIVKVIATTQSYAILTENGDLWVSNQFIEPFEIKNYRRLAKINQNDLFNGKKLLDIGGTYNVRYAIVQN